MLMQFIDDQVTLQLTCIEPLNHRHALPRIARQREQVDVPTEQEPVNDCRMPKTVERALGAILAHV